MVVESRSAAPKREREVSVRYKCTRRHMSVMDTNGLVIFYAICVKLSYRIDMITEFMAHVLAKSFHVR